MARRYGRAGGFIRKKGAANTRRVRALCELVGPLCKSTMIKSCPCDWLLPPRLEDHRRPCGWRSHDSRSLSRACVSGVGGPLDLHRHQIWPASVTGGWAWARLSPSALTSCFCFPLTSRVESRETSRALPGLSKGSCLSLPHTSATVITAARARGRRRHVCRGSYATRAGS